MTKTLDRTFDLSEDGLAARFRIRLFEPCEGDERADNSPERVLVTSWELDKPSLPLDSWAERMADETFPILHQQGSPLLLVEFYPERQYCLDGNLITLSEAITIARLQPGPEGKLALLDFGEMARDEIEERICESLCPGEETLK